MAVSNAAPALRAQLHRATLSSAASRLSTLLPRTFARHKSGPYGYTQAKSLVFSKYGEPSDVLTYVFHFVDLFRLMP